MKEVIISDEDKSINREEIKQKIERLDVYINRAKKRVETHIGELEKISDKYKEAKETAEDYLSGKKDVNFDL